MTQTETWKPVNGWPGYEVSDIGRVRSSRLWGGRAKGGGQLVGTGDRFRIRKLSESGPMGYYAITLNCGRKKERRLQMVHVLVLEAFVGPRPPGMQACHNDGNPKNNVVANLRWDTVANNNADKRLHGTWQVGENSGASRMTDEQVILARRMVASGFSHKVIALHCGVTKTTIRMIAAGETWPHLAAVPAPPLTDDEVVSLGPKRLRPIRSEDVIRDVLRMGAQGRGYKEIEDRTGVKPSYAYRIIKREIWRNVTI